MSRGLRLALLLAALAAAGPSVTAPRLVDAARAGVAIAWFFADSARRPDRRLGGPTLRVAAPAHVTVGVSRDAVLPDTLRFHSLYQRPPPLRG